MVSFVWPDSGETRRSPSSFPYNPTMAYRAHIKFNGETYWADISNDLRNAAINHAMENNLQLGEALSEVLGSEVVGVYDDSSDAPDLTDTDEETEE